MKFIWEWLSFRFCRHNNPVMYCATVVVDNDINHRPTPLRFRKLVCGKCGAQLDLKCEIPEELWQKEIEL